MELFLVPVVHLLKLYLPDNITPYAVDLSWNPGGSGGLIWNLEWGTSGFIQGNGSLINNLNNSYHTLTSLNPSTDYSFYVQEICSSNDQSSWSGPYNFTTNSLPPAPRKLWDVSNCII